MERSVKTFVKGIVLERTFDSDWKLCENIGALSKIKEVVANFAIEAGWENWQSVYVDERGGEIYKGGGQYLRLIEIKFNGVPYEYCAPDDRTGYFLDNKRIDKLCERVAKVGFGGEAEALIIKSIEERKTFSLPQPQGGD